MLWLRIVWTAGNLALWALAGCLFNVRQGKRVFSLIMAGPALAVIMSSLLASPGLALLGVTNFLLVASGSLGLVLGLVCLTTRRFQEQLHSFAPSARPDAATSARQTRSQPWQVCRQRYVVLMLVYTLLTWLGTYILEFAFFSVASTRYGQAVTLANFVSHYMGVTTILLLCVTLVSGRILSRYGLQVGLLAHPTVAVLGALAIATVGTVRGPTAVLFWLVIATKSCDEILLAAMTNTSMLILYQPLPAQQRVAVQTLVESVVSPCAIGLVGVMLLCIHATGNITVLHATYLLLIILIGWVGAWLLTREMC